MGLFGLGKNKININEAVNIIRDNPSAQLIDVREPDEYASGHIPGSVNIPVGKIGGADITDKDAQIYVYCASGMRSKMAAKILKDNGFTDVTNIGGIMSYRGPLE